MAHRDPPRWAHVPRLRRRQPRCPGAPALAQAPGSRWHCPAAMPAARANDGRRASLRQRGARRRTRQASACRTGRGTGHAGRSKGPSRGERGETPTTRLADPAGRPAPARRLGRWPRATPGGQAGPSESAELGWLADAAAARAAHSGGTSRSLGVCARWRHLRQAPLASEPPCAPRCRERTLVLPLARPSPEYSEKASETWSMAPGLAASPLRRVVAGSGGLCEAARCNWLRLCRPDLPLRRAGAGRASLWERAVPNGRAARTVVARQVLRAPWLGSCAARRVCVWGNGRRRCNQRGVRRTLRGKPETASSLEETHALPRLSLCPRPRA